MCYVNTVQLTEFLFFWCVVSFSLFSPLLRLQFLHEAFSQAGKHNYSMHVLNLIRFFGVCFSCVCFRWCFFIRPLPYKGPESTKGGLNLFQLLRKLTLNWWFGFFSDWGLKRMANVSKLYLNVSINININMGEFIYWIIWSKSKFDSWRCSSLGATEADEKCAEPEGDVQKWCQSQLRSKAACENPKPRNLSCFINTRVPCE